MDLFSAKSELLVYAQITTNKTPIYLNSEKSIEGKYIITRSNSLNYISQDLLLKKPVRNSIINIPEVNELNVGIIHFILKVPVFTALEVENSGKPILNSDKTNLNQTTSSDSLWYLNKLVLSASSLDDKYEIDNSSNTMLYILIPAFVLVGCILFIIVICCIKKQKMKDKNKGVKVFDLSYHDQTSNKGKIYKTPKKPLTQVNQIPNGYQSNNNNNQPIYNTGGFDMNTNMGNTPYGVSTNKMFTFGNSKTFTSNIMNELGTFGKNNSPQFMIQSNHHKRLSAKAIQPNQNVDIHTPNMQMAPNYEQQKK